MLDRLRVLFNAPVPSANGHGSAALPAAAESKGLLFAPGFVPLDAFGRTIERGELDLLEWYSGAWLPYACMRYRASKLVEAPLWVAEERDDGEEWLADHPLAELLERPNADMEMADLLELTSLYLDSTGAALWVKVRDRSGRTALLMPFAGSDFSVHAAQGRLYGRFEVRTRQGRRTYAPEDVVHFRLADPADPYAAASPLRAALARLGVDRTLVASIEASIRNAVVPGLVLGFPESVHLTREQRDELKADLALQYEGARNHGKPLLTGGGMTVTQGKLGMQGLEGGALSEEIEAAVCACFQVPPAVIGAKVGLVNSSDRHNMETAVALFYDNAIRPTWARLEKSITRQLLREVDPNPLRFIRFDTSRISALQVNQTEKSEVIAKAGRAIRVNEARVLLGLPPLEPTDPRGDEMVAAGNPMPPDLGAAPPKAASAPVETKAPSLRWQIHDATTRAAEFGWTLAAGAQLEADRSAVLALVRDAGKAGAAPAERKDPPPYGPADAELVRRLVKQIAEHMDLNAAVQWRDRVAPLIAAGGQQAVERLSAEVGLSFDLLQPGLLEYTAREAAWLVTQVTDTTKQQIRDALSAGLLEGAPLLPGPDTTVLSLVERLEALPTFSRERATLIAQTETTRVTNGAQRDALSKYQAESGDWIVKEWLTAGDSRVRPEHVALAGEKRPIDEPFSNGLQAPGEPRCRCTLVYQMEAA